MHQRDLRLVGAQASLPRGSSQRCWTSSASQSTRELRVVRALGRDPSAAPGASCRRELHPGLDLGESDRRPSPRGGAMNGARSFIRGAVPTSKSLSSQFRLARDILKHNKKPSPKES